MQRTALCSSFVIDLQQVFRLFLAFGFEAELLFRLVVLEVVHPVRSFEHSICFFHFSHTENEHTNELSRNVNEQAASVPPLPDDYPRIQFFAGSSADNHPFLKSRL
jgi:hypothetical protein